METARTNQAWDQLERLFKSETQHELIDSLQNILGHYSVDFFAYLGLNFGTGHTSPILISTYPKTWCDHYLEKLYYSFDPVIQGARENVLPFEWGSMGYLSRLSKKQKTFFNEAAEFGVVRGLTFPMHGVQNQVSSMSLAWSDNPELDLYSKNILQLAAMHFHVRQVEMMTRNHEFMDPIRLSPPRGRMPDLGGPWQDVVGNQHHLVPVRAYRAGISDQRHEKAGLRQPRTGRGHRRHAGFDQPLTDAGGGPPFPAVSLHS
jgi:hypothetical protein